MPDRLDILTSSELADVLEIERFGPQAGRPADLLIEIPHGATERRHYDVVRSRLSGELPRDLEAFFHVNTDVGAPELGTAIARELGAFGVTTWIVRCLVPRTFVDTNRVLDGAAPGGMTAGLPDYLTEPHDRELLGGLHARYCATVERLYEAVCGPGGLALALHTYAPRSVEATIDAEVVASLRRAYSRGVYSSWPLRPEVDLITAGPAGEDLSPVGVADAVAAALAKEGLVTSRNATYHLHPATQGYRLSARFPGQVLCLEARRDRLGAPWRPFAPTRVGPRKTERLARPIAAALAPFLAGDRPFSFAGSRSRDDRGDEAARRGW